MGKVTVHADDLRGVSRLTIAGIAGIVDLVEAMHRNIASVPVGRAPKGRTTGITGFVYRSIRGVVGVVEYSLDALLARLAPVLGRSSTWPGREAVVSALNGVLGDYLATTRNPLAIEMAFRRGGAAMLDDRAAMAEALPDASGKVLVLVHGLCMNDLQWERAGHDHGAALARDLGFTPVYVHYNTGRHISENGRELADRLERLIRHWPVPVAELVVIGHSMGGLVARSACFYGELARHEWRRRLDKIVFLGTPHHGAPLEKGGNWIDILLGVSRYSAPLARLGKIRSSGITDLRHGNLVDEDWKARDRFAMSGDGRVAMPLPAGAACYTIAATTAEEEDGVSALIGDGLVPLGSALGRHERAERALAFDASRQWVARGVHHLDLLSDAAVYARIEKWLSQD